MAKKKYQKKIKLSKQNKRTRWAPVWAVLRKFGAGKRVHPSAITSVKRNWRRTKLKIKPRRQKKPHMG
jgi:ribosomal protein L39E